MKLGTKVRVFISSKDECYSMLKKYNGKEMIISRKVIKGPIIYYELEGAVSDMGIPYSFAPDHLINMSNPNEGNANEWDN